MFEIKLGNADWFHRFINNLFWFQDILHSYISLGILLALIVTHKVPIRTTADDKF